MFNRLGLGVEKQKMTNVGRMKKREGGYRALWVQRAAPGLARALGAFRHRCSMHRGASRCKCLVKPSDVIHACVAS